MVFPRSCIPFFCLCLIIFGTHAAPVVENRSGANGGDGEENDDIPVDNAQKALEEFSITLSDDSEVAESLFSITSTKNTIFLGGELVEAWNPTAESSETQFHHGPYVDRITFDFYFGTLPNYKIEKPTVTSSAKSVAEPQVIDFQTDQEEKSGAFTVVYDCLKRQESSELNTSIVVTVPVTEEKIVVFGFRKTCGGGHHKFIDMGYYAMNGQGVDSESLGQRMTFPQPRLVVGPHVSSTRIFLLLHKPADTQEFFHITSNIVAESKEETFNGLDVAVQGPVFGGVLRRNRPVILYVVYECKSHGTHKLTLTVPLRPFKDLTATWEKDCGGGAVQGLHIGSEPGKNDIAKDGKTQARWLLGLTASSGRISNDAPVVNISQKIQDIWIANGGKKAIHIAQEVITIEKPDLLWVQSTREGDGVMINTENNEQSGVVESGRHIRLRLRMVCKKKGRSLVVVTLPIKSFQRIEFGFVKECRAPRQFYHSGFLRTAHSTMLAVSLFLVTSFIMCWRLIPGETKNTSSSNLAISSNPMLTDGESVPKARRSGRKSTRYSTHSQEKIELLKGQLKDTKA